MSELTLQEIVKKEQNKKLMERKFKYDVITLLKLCYWSLNPFPNGLTYNKDTYINPNNDKVKNIQETAKKLEKKFIYDLPQPSKSNSKAKKLGFGKIGENLVYDILSFMGENPRKPQKYPNCCYQVDWEGDNYIWEVKTRSWTEPGTAGEKVLGTMYKYSDLPVIYGKPLKIVCIGYQEYELCNNNTRIWNVASERKKKMLELARSFDIEYIKFSDLVKPFMKEKEVIEYEKPY